MNKAVRRMVTAVAGMMFALCTAFSPLNQSSAAQSSETKVKPLLLERNEGELRTRRIHTDASTPASSQFTLKVSPKTTALSIWSLARKNLLRERPYRSTGTLGPR
jgi:hypothetical protein